MIENVDTLPNEGPWNAGLRSTLTRELLALATIFRSENAFNDLNQIMEFNATTGLPIERLAVLRPMRLALHEVLIRTTADYEIPDPDDAAIGSLGANLRRIAQTFMEQTVVPNEAVLTEIYNRAQQEMDAFIRIEARALESAPVKVPVALVSGRFRDFFGRRLPSRAEAPQSEWERLGHVVRSWRSAATATDKPLREAGLNALADVAEALQRRHGRIIGRDTFLIPLAVQLACNDYAARAIGDWLDPMIRRIAEGNGFYLLPRQDKPIAMVTKGASASGKSTMRPFQHELATRMGVRWSDFALISPDTWRRALLDYGSLGASYKYAGMLTSQEVAIVDQKLDAYLVRKGSAQRASHLLVDRFRFDSFALDSPENQHLPSRFGSKSLYFFMVTPPQEIVERGWKRGLELGRFKAVDDLLAHAVEAYTGMQNILFGRALTPNAAVHYELLNNDVPRGERPLTAAFGWSGEMNIFDLECILDVERFRKVRIDARGPEELYASHEALVPANNTGFLIKCLRQFPRVSFVAPETGQIYALFEQGKLVGADWDKLAHMLGALGLNELRHMFGASATMHGPIATPAEVLSKSKYLTIGRWAART